MFSITLLLWFLYCSLKTGPSTAISLKGQLYLLSLSLSTMNSDANEFFSSNATKIGVTTTEAEHVLFTLLKTDFQLDTAHSILHEWNTATILLALSQEWSTRHENKPIERNVFSLLVYNISSLRSHVEDIIDYISGSFSNIWALTELYFNDHANDQLASYFNSRYTIYYQHVSNSFRGICLAIGHEVPHRIASDFSDINSIIAADVFNSNKNHAVPVVYSPLPEEVPTVIFNRLYRHNRNLTNTDR